MKKKLLSVVVGLAIAGVSMSAVAADPVKDEKYGGVPLSSIGSSLTQQQIDQLKSQQAWLQGQLEIETLKAKINKVKESEKTGADSPGDNKDKNPSSVGSGQIQVQNMSGMPIIGPNGQMINPMKKESDVFILGGVMGSSKNLSAQIITPDGNQVQAHLGDMITPDTKVVKISDNLVVLEQTTKDRSGQTHVKYIQVLPGVAAKSTTPGM